MTKQELKKLIKEVINEAEFDDMQINSPDDLDYSDAKPGQVVTIQDMERHLKYARFYMKLIKFFMPDRMVKDFNKYFVECESDMAKIKQLHSVKPFNKIAYLDAISRFRTKYGKILKP
jgi:hypothetical protein